MPTQVAQPPITAEMYQLLPETGPRYQVIQGELHMAPAPNRFHQDISKQIAKMMLVHLDEHSIGEVYIAPFDVYLDEYNVYQPDLAHFSESRYHLLSDRGAEGAPDLVIEILSKRTGRIDETIKKEVFAQKGVREMWIIEPTTKSVRI